MLILLCASYLCWYSSPPLKMDVGGSSQSSRIKMSSCEKVLHFCQVPKSTTNPEPLQTKFPSAGFLTIYANVGCKYSDRLRPSCGYNFSRTGFPSLPHSQRPSVRSQGSFPHSIELPADLIQVISGSEIPAYIHGRVFLGTRHGPSSKLSCLPSPARPSKLQVNFQGRQIPLGKLISQCFSLS